MSVTVKNNDSVVDPTEAVKPDLGGTPEKLPSPGKTPVRRGTTNGNARGGSETRRRRREWLVRTYRANEDVIEVRWSDGDVFWVAALPGTEGAQPACRCYRCGVLLTTDTLTVDRIVPGCQGGTYKRANIRPACATCNASTGATTRRK